MELTEIQKNILEGKICQYCLNKTEFVDSVCIYGVSYGMIYLCRQCNAYCGVHKGTNKSLGRVANKELRLLKQEAHKYFDQLWQNGHLKRKNAYAKLADFLKIPTDYCHIGMFSPDGCKLTIEFSKTLLQSYYKSI